MKKFLMTILVALLSVPIFSQEQQVVYGTVRTDGFSKITKGAFWSKRPEAKMIYGGSYPPDYTVIDLTEEYYVRFKDSEHNSFDGNYIVFPRGEKIYRNNITGAYFAAVCGNEIEYLCPVNRVIIQKETQIVEVEKQTTESTTTTPIVINNYLPQEQQEQQEVVYYNDDYRYYVPQYSNGFIAAWDMMEYYIWDGMWRRASYSAYCNWDTRNRRCDNLGRYNHRDPPSDVRHREHRPHPKDGGGPGGSKPNHDTGGGPGGSGRNNDGGPGGAGRNYDGGPGGTVSRSNTTSSYGSYSRSNSRNTNVYNRGTSSRQSSSYSRGSAPSRMNNAFNSSGSRSSYSRGSNASFRGSSNSAFSRGGSSGMSRSSSSSRQGTAFRR